MIDLRTEAAANVWGPDAEFVLWNAEDEHTLITTSQNPHVIRLLMGAFVLGIPEHKLRVWAPDVGGGFGSKIYHYAEEAFVTWAAKQVGRPIKWVAERSESFV
ncbi:MAG: molybdopterin cofactor-binding domain-containing protein, partial [Pseudomonadota bacterium]